LLLLLLLLLLCGQFFEKQAQRVDLVLLWRKGRRLHPGRLHPGRLHPGRLHPGRLQALIGGQVLFLVSLDAWGAADWRLKSFGSIVRGVCGGEMENDVEIFAWQVGVAAVRC
jgi:hypothetical protein